MPAVAQAFRPAVRQYTPLRRGTEVVVTGAPRKRLVAQAARGFESHPLRQSFTNCEVDLTQRLVRRSICDVGGADSNAQAARIRGASNGKRQPPPVLESRYETCGDRCDSHEERRWPRLVEPHLEGCRHQMTTHYPIVLEHEPNGTVSAYVVGVAGVFAAAETERAATAAIRKALAAHLDALEAL